MAQYSPHDLLGWPNVMKSIFKAESGLDPIFPDEWYAGEGSTGQVEGDEGGYNIKTGTGEPATLSEYDAASKNIKLQPIENRQMKLISSRENLTLQTNEYAAIMDMDAVKLDPDAAKLLNYYFKEAKQRIANARVVALVGSIFANQILYDSSGRPTNPITITTTQPGFVGQQYATGVTSTPTGGVSVGAFIPNGTTGITIPMKPTTVGTNFGIGTGLDPLATGQAVIGKSVASWFLQNTDIAGQVRAYQSAMAILTRGGAPKHAWCGNGIFSCIARNADLGWYSGHNAERGKEYLDTGEITDLLGMTWHNASRANFQDYNGNFQRLVGDNMIAFTPDYSPEWLSWLNGSYMIPSTADIIEPKGALNENMKKKYGVWAFAQAMADPTTAKIVFGDTMLPVIKNPLLVGCTTVY